MVFRYSSTFSLVELEVVSHTRPSTMHKHLYPDWVWLVSNVLPSWNTTLEGNHMFIDVVIFFWWKRYASVTNSTNDRGYFPVYVGRFTWPLLVACCRKVCENCQESFLGHYLSNARNAITLLPIHAETGVIQVTH